MCAQGEPRFGLRPELGKVSSFAPVPVNIKVYRLRVLWQGEKEGHPPKKKLGIESRIWGGWGGSLPQTAPPQGATKRDVLRTEAS